MKDSQSEKIYCSAPTKPVNVSYLAQFPIMSKKPLTVVNHAGVPAPADHDLALFIRNLGAKIRLAQKY